jgi:hypothetical protein
MMIHVENKLSLFAVRNSYAHLNYPVKYEELSKVYSYNRV